MAPSVEIKSTNNDSSLDIQTKDNLIFPPSDLKVTSDQECEKIRDDEEKVRTYRAKKTFSKYYK